MSKDWYQCTGLQYNYHRGKAKQVKECVDEIKETRKRDYYQSKSQEKEKGNRRDMRDCDDDDGKRN